MVLLLVAVVEAVANSVAVASMQAVRFQMVQKDLDQFHMDDFGLHLKNEYKYCQFNEKNVHRKVDSPKKRTIEETIHRKIRNIWG